MHLSVRDVNIVNNFSTIIPTFLKVKSQLVDLTGKEMFFTRAYVKFGNDLSGDRNETNEDIARGRRAGFP